MTAHRRYQPWTTTDLDDAVAGLRAGQSVAAVAAELGRTPLAVWSHLSVCGVSVSDIRRETGQSPRVFPVRKNPATSPSIRFLRLYLLAQVPGGVSRSEARVRLEVNDRQLSNMLRDMATVVPVDVCGEWIAVLDVQAAAAR